MFGLFIAAVHLSNFSRDDLGLPTIPSLRYLHIHVSTSMWAFDQGHCVSPVILRFLRGILSEHPQPAPEVPDLKLSWTAFASPPIIIGPQQAANGGNIPPLMEPRHWNALDEVPSSTVLYPKLHGVRFTPNVRFSSPFSNQPGAKNTVESKVPASGLFQTEVTAVMQSTRTRLLVFHASGTDTGDGRAFGEARKSILEQGGIYRDIL